MSDAVEFVPSEDDDLWLHPDGSECTDPAGHKCSAGPVSAEFRRQAAEFMKANDELMRRLAQ